MSDPKKADGGGVEPPLISSQPKKAENKKKTVVISPEQLKEMQRQAKQMRDERKATMDARHAFIIQKLADVLAVDKTVVEDFLAADENFGMVDEFFVENGSRRLMFFYQDAKRTNAFSGKPDGGMERRLFVTNGANDPLKGVGFVFLRTTTKAITPNNISTEVTFQIIDAANGKLIEAIEKLVAQTVMPLFRTYEDWGTLNSSGRLPPAVSEFLDMIDQFVDALVVAKSNSDQQVVLQTESKDISLDILVDKSASDLQLFASSTTSSEYLQKLEELVGGWMRQIEQVLAESEQIRRETDDIGPAAELSYWRARMSKFNSLLEQMKSPRVVSAILALHHAKSKVIKRWKYLDGRITDYANEAKDNVKYLYALERYFVPLAKCSPVELIEHIPGLINVMRMIYSVAQFYNTSERMTSLFVKITNQLIASCRSYLNHGVTKIWELETDELLKRIHDCLQLNREYQYHFHRIKDKLKETPEEKQFDFSENYIFGKFDMFSKRLERIRDVIKTMTAYSPLTEIKIEGIDSVAVRYKTIFDTFKKKSYDMTDIRRVEFDNDYQDFKNSMQNLQVQIQAFADTLFERPLSIDQQLQSLAKLSMLGNRTMDFTDKYQRVLLNYGRDLEQVKRYYQKNKMEPVVARNMPPVSGKIAWARHLMERIEKPMHAFEEFGNGLLSTEDGQRIVRSYNKVATVLLEYQVIFHRSWYKKSQEVKRVLNVSLLVKDAESGRLFINFDPSVLEVFQEARFLKAFGFEVPDFAETLLQYGDRLRDHHNRLHGSLDRLHSAQRRVPGVLVPLTSPFRRYVEEAISPGLTILTWTSTGLGDYVDGIDAKLVKFELLVKELSDTLECRIEDGLDNISERMLCYLPDDEPLTADNWLSESEQVGAQGTQALGKRSLLVEKALVELLDAVVYNLEERDRKHMSLAEGFECINTDAKHKDRCQACLPCASYQFLTTFVQRSTEALVRCSRFTLDTMKRRLAASAKKFSKEDAAELKKVPVLKASVELILPNIVVRPSVDEIQTTINKVAQNVLRVAQNMPAWEQVSQIYTRPHASKAAAAQQEEKLDEEDTAVEGAEPGSPVKDKEAAPAPAPAPQQAAQQPQPSSQKPLTKIISENKDITKTLFQLSTVMSTFKPQVNEIVDQFNKYAVIWSADANVKVKEFLATKPTLSEVQSQIKFYNDIEQELLTISNTTRIGPLSVSAEPIKTSLATECRNWKWAYGRLLNEQCTAQMDELTAFFESLSTRLNRPIKDLDDVRGAIAALTELRENEIRVDLTLGPIEETYALLNKFELTFNDGNAERVDTISYGWRKLRVQAEDVRDKLLDVQPRFKEQLLSGVTQFKIDVDVYATDYDTKGPNVSGISPREASDRLQIFQAQFDELWRKFTTYSGGEELFGLPVTDYPDLQRLRKELSLLQKLYQLYDTVLEKVNGYYDIPWTDLNIEQINTELTDFQNRCRKLPKALRDYQAFEDLRKTIDDFNETCPLLEMMANKSMQMRHWERIENLTNHKFDVESENFLLRNVMEAPLLKFKDDIEDICISAVKERDIDAKLKQVINDWGAQSFQFASFKSRGELLLKGDVTQEIISAMEDSLMILSSLMSNRYNVPFRPKIQEWISKLTTSSEIIENWLIVQNLWIYLEAVFVAGDIAKQLPQEAKRFQGIDKNWQKVMQRAHDMPNVIQCCVGDDMMSQLLPHLLEQLEICQKSLTGYLEKKRLVFPRFFFVSDPALLEILGQASDSHTIQAHLLSIFDNTKTVTFDEKVYDRILRVNSSEGETIPLDEWVMAQGNVEAWLGDLLKMSLRSVHSVIKQAAIAIQDPNLNLIEFLGSSPAQIGLLSLQFLWTHDAEEALTLAKSDKKAMQLANNKFLNILNELINVTTRELTKVERTKFETHITIHVHQRDIFDDLCKMHIRSPQDFEWLKQSRFYYKEDTDSVTIQITDVDFEYQNEFLGCTERLVVTPLTDRCYITLSQAIGLSMGGAPAGPAGTGKTETTKDMGRCLGKYVVVFNCSDQMDFRGLGRIFKGLAQSGSWGCFDEFNRIELPVLSVAAQQIDVVLKCRKERKPQFVFTDGDIVDMDPEFGIFLTMNPGYAGRQELPENLKINFRTVAMMVPDRAIIIRVKLASCGFIQNVPLAKKFYTLYKLCEEQLSKQIHYDFGLRNILSVLRTLGAFKRSNPQDGEPMIVMRVLRDMNLSKLVDEDEPLFMSLIDDLFPGMVLDKKGYPEMEAAIAKNVQDMGLINHPAWILKVIQLFETQRVRHGMMTLGPTGVGKSRCIQVLMRALTDCGTPHREMRMNPKAITAPQMFGRLDVATNDWTDGIFSTLWRRTHKAKKGESIWIILDGPIDAIWIENLNSVLDDNKTLTLANGDRIPMYPNCKLIFEVHNVDNASPATVSRNGMVFMSSSILDFRPILRGWLLKRPAQQQEVIFNVFDQSFGELYAYVTQTLTPKMDMLECVYTKQALDLMEGLIPVGDEAKELTSDWIQRLVTFSIMWSLGALLELDDRRKLQEKMLEYRHALQLPAPTQDDSIYEFVVNEKGTWEHWNARVPQYIYPTDSVPEYTGVIVPNVDNTRIDFLVHTIAKQSKAVLLIGESGSAKTVIIKRYCQRYDPEQQVVKQMNFSSATSPLMVQRAIESYVDKRVGTTYGPPAGRKMTVFIDDVNMPIINTWGDQITNELTRQFMEQKGFYNLEKPGEFTTIVDVQVIAAMIHPGGGRNDIPQRLKRQFCIFNSTLPSNTSIDRIFSTIGLGYFCAERGFPAAVTDAVGKLVGATRKLWQKTKVKMLPTPAKFHYVFNLRDLSRIWQGITYATSEVITTPQMVVSLWKHECLRVIPDRFVDAIDKEWFDKVLRQVAEEECGDAGKQMMEDPLFVDFLRDAPEPTGEEGEDAEMETPKVYEPIPSYDALRDRLMFYQGQYNELVRGGKMDLVFFKDAMLHLARISRIVRTPKGHALLVGVGGSGKQSLTRLASFIAGYKTFQITLTRSYNISNLMDDLKQLYRTAGAQGKGITFILTDNEIKDEAFLEPINNMLSSGEVSNLFARDEMDEILQELVGPMKKEFPRRPPTNENLYEYYMSRVLRNLHVALCFSPVGEKFRGRSLKFPALISGCTIDWFQRWPKDALVSVSTYFLQTFDIICTQNVKNTVMSMIGQFQDMVAEACTEYFQRFRRQTHVTPKSYLSFLGSYKAVYAQKREEIQILANRMNTGLKKLVEATESVNEMSKELSVKEKELAVANKKAEQVLAEVSVKAQAASKVKAQVQLVKDKAQQIVDGITVDKAIAEEKLEAARPAIEAAEQALQTIKASHIQVVKKLAKPPHLIMRILDCVLVFFSKRMDTVTMDPERPCVKPSWGEALKLMGSATFLNDLLNFPKDSINDEHIELLQPYFDAEDYNYESACKVAKDVAGLCSWTKAMGSFFTVNKEVLPLKANLVVQEARLKMAMNDLQKAQDQLDEKQRELDVVQAQYDAAMREKQALEDDANATRRKMVNATALIDGLSGERVRWTETSKGFEAQLQRLVGDVLLATAFLSYSGPFNQEFRNNLLKAWRRELVQQKVPFSEDLNIISMLVDNATISEWNVQGLPSDELSTQNGLIATKASRYPLLIDPQGQGKQWIKNREKANELLVTSLNHKYFRSHIEDSLSIGRPLLIEDVGDELDPVLDNILEKNYIKSGTRYKVKVGDKELDVMANFRLYITTKLPNPSYTPEIYARTAIIDFTVTMRGLEDQLLSLVILKEKQELEAERTKLVEDVAANKRKMKELEDSLLYRLTSTEGSLVEDEGLIEVLRTTKTTAEEVKEKLAFAAETEAKINAAREEFRPVATRGSILYFVIVEMSMVNIMYQTSLKQFLGEFDVSMTRSTKSPITSKRVQLIIDYLTFEAFRYISRGLYEVDKFLFVLLMTMKIDMQGGRVRFDEFQTFIKGGAALDLNAVEPKPKKWIQDLTWLNLVALSKLPQFTKILESVNRSDKQWKAWFDDEAPENCPFPDEYNSLSTFHKLLLVRSWCPDRTVPMARKYIAESVGPAFVESVILNLEEMVEEANPRVPMICFLSMGSDPTENIERQGKRMNRKCGTISMGQGQEVPARRLFQQAAQEGRWVLFQNCHLGLQFMDELIDSVNTTDPIHEDFRCWITTEPHPKFPINLLQMSIKFTNEPPQGIKAGLKRTYTQVTQDQLDYTNLPYWKPLLYCVGFLHTVVQERRKFGPVGWNIPYEFNQADYSSSVQYIQKHLDDMDPKRGISWVTIRYMIGEVHYGGRVTDDYDKRLLNTFARVWFADVIFAESFQFYKGYIIPRFKAIDEYRGFIEQLPLVDSPDALGLHPNAELTYQMNTSNTMLNTIVNIQPKETGGGGGETREAVVYRQADDMLSKLPADYVPHEVRERLRKMDHLKPLHIFLRQEIDRMQKVLTIVRSTLIDLKLAIDGTIIMSENLRDALDNMYDARIPTSWKRLSWESATLGFWFTDLLDRNTQFSRWLNEGRPNCYWMTGFFNPQGFLTAMRQEITRAHKGWALDAVVLSNDVTKMMEEDVSSGPSEGVYVKGLYLEGAAWDRRNAKLMESSPKILYVNIPVVHVFAINTDRPKGPTLYECPVYKKPRRTDLNYIFPLILKTSKDPDHWTLRGVALLCDVK